MKCKNFKSCGRETRGNSKLCGSCYSKEYRKNNKEKIEISRKKYIEKNYDRIKEWQDKWKEKNRLNNNRQDVLERDNFQCTMCGMSQEQHILLFNKKLIIHHKDEMGRLSETPNHALDNLQTVCFNCHNTIHKSREGKQRYRGLLEQDDSEYKYPKIREICDNKKKKLGTITKAKKELAGEMGLKYSSVDHLYYERKREVKDERI